MAPNRGNKDVYVHEIDRTPEYTEFIEKLQAFHKDRGTSFEPEPRLGTMYGHVSVDLYKIYKTAIEQGGYDHLCSVQKGWANFAQDMGMHFSDNKAQGQLNFQLKTIFYRYLAAYWVKDQHGQEPPPKEILEDLSCASKHGPVLTRTLENFKFPPKGEETPTKEERQVEGTPTSTNRASGRLREAPPQRVPFQPETGPSRQSRHTSSQNATPTPSATHTPSNAQPQQHSHHIPPPQQHQHTNPLHVIQAHQASLRGARYSPPANSENASRLTETFEPRRPISVPLRPVNTPGNNPVEYSKQVRQLRRQGSDLPDPQAPNRLVLPGYNWDGPNIYTRCLQALRSGIPTEQAFALNHLVKISYERGDKYKFESFLGLAEGLIEKALEIGALFYDVDWQISYTGDESPDIAVLDGLNGTDDIIERIKRLPPKVVLDNMQPSDFGDRLIRITEAVLTTRNMVMLVENAIYMAEVSPLRDLLCIILHLPNLEMLVELKHFALEIAEQITPWLIMDAEDPLYRTLLARLDSTDRGTILTSMRAISRISMNLEATNKLPEVPDILLRYIVNWLLLNDEELMDACLDFLYQYTAVVLNVECLLKAVDMEHLVQHLVRLLGHGAKRVKDDKILEPETKTPCSEEVAPLPQDLQERLTGTDEPQRCTFWLQSLFEEDAESHITQIAIWQAYQGSFGGLVTGPRNMLTAADFIRNVSHVFKNARAQIIRGPGQAHRFIIEGIRARTVPINYETNVEYSRCQWLMVKGPYSRKCNHFFLGGEQMWHHVLMTHLGVHIGENGKIDDMEIEKSCDWDDCVKYSKSTKMRLSELTRHIKTHVLAPQKRSQPDGQQDPQQAKRQRRSSYITPAKTMPWSWVATMSTRDERNPKIEQPAGIPLSAVLVLRNIARNVVKTESEEELLKQQEMGGEGGGWNERLFRPMMPRLFEVMAENKLMAGYITSLLQLVQDDF